MPSESGHSWLRWIVGACVGAVIALGAAYLAVWQWAGTSEAALALLRGQELVVVPNSVELGDCSAGEIQEIELRVLNLSSSRMRLTGVYTSCSCILASELPVVVDGRGASTLRLTIHASGAEGRFTRQAVLYTDSKRSPQLPVVVSGRNKGADADVELVPIAQPTSRVGAAGT